jgi:hypothetical protein
MRLKSEAVIGRIRYYAMQRRIHPDEALLEFVNECLDRHNVPGQSQLPAVFKGPQEEDYVERNMTAVLFALKQAKDNGMPVVTLVEVMAATRLTQMKARYALDQLIAERSVAIQKVMTEGRGRKPWGYSLRNP